MKPAFVFLGIGFAVKRLLNEYEGFESLARSAEYAANQYRAGVRQAETLHAELKKFLKPVEDAAGTAA